MPALNNDIKYTATYYDASVHNPERLTLDVLQDGEKAGLVGAGSAGGASATARTSNYLAVTSIEADGVELTDQLTGEKFSFTADVIVNSSGAWVDQTNEAIGAETRFMGGTKGSHIVLDHPELLAACNGREIFFEHTDGRIVLIYPMGDRVLVGTTDIDANVNEDTVCTDAEVEYFFDLIGHVFPNIKIDAESIVYTFSGVRPLPRHDETAPGFVSRDYRIERADRQIAGTSVPVLSLVGGKWTTFRALAEHMANDVLAILGVERQISTAKLPIGGGTNFPANKGAVEAWISAHTSKKIDAARASVLLTRYGTRAAKVIEYLADGDDHGFESTSELSTREIEFMVEHEQIGHLVDVFIRRTSLAFRGLITTELLAETAAVLAEPLGWNAQRVTDEIAHAQDILDRFHRVKVQSLTSSIPLDKRAE